LNTGLRILLTLGIAGAVLISVMGPRWRGSFYRSWLRPRMVAFGILLAAFTTAFYVYRVLNALGNR
jgi:hypothetical protein